MNRMKYTFITLSLLLSVLILVSCEDFLMKAPESNISEDEAFENYTNFQGYVEELYGTIPNFTNAYWVNNWNWGDEIDTPDSQLIHDSFDNGDFWAWQNNGTSWIDKPSSEPAGDRFNRDLWDLGWYGIRKANKGLNELDTFQGTQAQSDVLEGQMLFFRGWYHFQFMQFFGDMPYLSEPIAPDAQFNQKRIPYQDLADSVAQDLRRAADVLPIDWDDTEPGARTSGNNEMRINKIMALGYLGKNLLWAASPLMNQGPGGESGAAGYDQEYARRAANAFGELINLVESGQTWHELEPFEDWHSLFYTEGQNFALAGGDEAIFRSFYYKGDDSQYNTAKQYHPTVVGASAGNLFPTHNYVKNFGMANGMPIEGDLTEDDPASGYDASHPWQNRDPRFYKTFIHDGMEVVQANIPGNPEDRYANLYTDGSWRSDGNHPRAQAGNSNTGYVLRKFVPLSANRFDNGYSFGSGLNIQVPWMRLAGIYIMYAEAAAVANQSANGTSDNNDMTAVEAINKVRDRAGVGHVASQFTDDVDEFLSEVRREWAVELGFEKNRFTNLRRWLLLTDPAYANKTKLHFDRPNGFDPSNDSNPRDNEALNLSEEVIMERNYSQRHYWLPLKRQDVQINPNFDQNPGW